MWHILNQNSIFLSVNLLFIIILFLFYKVAPNLLTSIIISVLEALHIISDNISFYCPCSLTYTNTLCMHALWIVSLNLFRRLHFPLLPIVPFNPFYSLILQNFFHLPITTLHIWWTHFLHMKRCRKWKKFGFLYITLTMVNEVVIN